MSLSSLEENCLIFGEESLLPRVRGVQLSMEISLLVWYQMCSSYDITLLVLLHHNYRFKATVYAFIVQPFMLFYHAIQCYDNWDHFDRFP